MVLIDTSMEIGTDLQTKCFEKAVFTTTSANKKKGDFTYANEGKLEYDTHLKTEHVFFFQEKPRSPLNTSRTLLNMESNKSPLL